MPWVPIGHRVLVKPMDLQDDLKKKYSHIDIPESVTDVQQYAWNRGELVDWGPTAGMHFDGKTMKELGLKRGDKILYNQYAGLTFKDENGVGFRVINDQDINMVWRDAEEGTEFTAGEEAVSG